MKGRRVEGEKIGIGTCPLNHTILCLSKKKIRDFLVYFVFFRKKVETFDDFLIKYR